MTNSNREAELQRVAEAIEQLGVSEIDALDFAKAAIKAMGGERDAGVDWYKTRNKEYKQVVRELEGELAAAKQVSAKMEDALREITSYRVDMRAHGQIIGMGPTHISTREALKDAQMLAKSILDSLPPSPAKRGGVDE